MADKIKNVLIVEDEKPLLNAIRMKLEKSGFGVVTARTANQALHYLEDVPDIDIIWLDHYLIGKETGLDLVVQIKSNPAWKKIPIFLVSNTASQSKVSSYIKFGITKYYTKADFRLDQIIEDIKKTMNQ
jgi:CheY-like chemotaxis protein